MPAVALVGGDHSAVVLVLVVLEDAASDSVVIVVVIVLPVAVMIVDLMDTILTWNIAAERLFDVPAGSALARKFRDLDVSYRVEGLRARIEEVKVHQTGTRLEDVTLVALS